MFRKVEEKTQRWLEPVEVWMLQKIFNPTRAFDFLDLFRKVHENVFWWFITRSVSSCQLIIVW